MWIECGYPLVDTTLPLRSVPPQTGSALFLSDTVAFSPLRVNCTPPASSTPARSPAGATASNSAPATAAPAWSPRELATVIEAARTQRVGGGWERARALQALLSQCTGPVVPFPTNKALPVTPAGNSSSGSGGGSGSTAAAVRIAFLSVRPKGMWLAAVQSATVSPSGAVVAAAQGSAGGGGGGGGIRALQLLPGVPFNVSVQLYDDNNQSVTAGAYARGFRASGLR